MARVIHVDYKNEIEEIYEKQAIDYNNHPFRPPWMSDSSTKCCLLCTKEFSFSLRRHHCRLCGRIFCDDCSQKKRILPPEFDYYDVPQRVCDSCHNTLQRQEKPKEDFSLAVQFFLREVPQFSLHKLMIEIGSRSLPDKGFCTIQYNDSKQCLALVKPRAAIEPLYVTPGKQKSLRELLMDTIKHPHILPVTFTKYLNSGEKHYLVVLRNFCPDGSLRDLINKCKPSEEYGLKYNSNKATPLSSEQIKLIGRQILEALSYLQTAGFPYPHLHTANVLIKDKKSMTVCLSDLENTVMGLSPLYESHLIDLPQGVFPELICFGNVLFELALGIPKSSITSDVQQLKDKFTNPEVFQIVNSIFSNNPPTIRQLLQNPFFECPNLKTCADVDLQIVPSQIPNKSKVLLKLLRDDVREILFSPEEKEKRKDTMSPMVSPGSSPTASPVSSPRKEKKKKKKNGTVPGSPKTKKKKKNETPVKPPSTPVAPTPPKIGGPAPPPPPPALKELPPSQPGRNALLDSIRNPNNLKTLKKVNKKE